MEPRKRLDICFSIPLTLPTAINWRAWLPSRGNVVFTLLVVAAFFWVQRAVAFQGQATNAISGTSTGTWPYQGRLADSAGNPITATVPMIFRLYNAPGSATAPLWEEQWTGPSSVQVSDGLFNVMLGSLTPIPQSVLSGNGSLWLGITAGTDDEMAPRVQLGSVPYAAQALTVPDGVITTAKLADASVTTSKIANGTVTQAKLGADVNLIPPDGSITTAKLADQAVNSSKLADSSVTDSKLNLTRITYSADGSVAINAKLVIRGTDLVFDASGRGDAGRAMIQDTGDTLKINYNRDFTGGVIAYNFRTGGIVEENLQTEAEQSLSTIGRFSQGDVLCWDAAKQQLEKCSVWASSLVVAIADSNGRPLILGAEPVKVIGTVEPGDLLVASSVAGYAMSWNGNGEPPMGTVIAKALEACNQDMCLVKALLFSR